MNNQQIEMMIRWALAPVGTVIGAWLISKGADATSVAALGGAAVMAIAFGVQFVWGLLRKTDKQLLAQASTVKGAEVNVDTRPGMASPGALAAVNDDAIPNVQPKAA